MKLALLFASSYFLVLFALRVIWRPRGWLARSLEVITKSYAAIRLTTHKPVDSV